MGSWKEESGEEAVDLGDDPWDQVVAVVVGCVEVVGMFARARRAASRAGASIEGDVLVPAEVGADLVVVEAGFVLGGLAALGDAPSAAEQSSAG